MLINVRNVNDKQSASQLVGLCRQGHSCSGKPHFTDSGSTGVAVLAWLICLLCSPILQSMRLGWGGSSLLQRIDLRQVSFHALTVRKHKMITCKVLVFAFPNPRGCMPPNGVDLLMEHSLLSDQEVLHIERQTSACSRKHILCTKCWEPFATNKESPADGYADRNMHLFLT